MSLFIFPDMADVFSVWGWGQIQQGLVIGNGFQFPLQGLLQVMDELVIVTKHFLTPFWLSALAAGFQPKCS